MRRKRILIVLVLMPVLVLLGKAQTNIAFYPLENQFNSSDFNPAFLTSKHRFTFSGLPLGGTTIGHSNQQIVNELVLKILSGVSMNQDYQDMLGSMVDRSLINQNIESSLLTFTYRSKGGFLNFRIKEIENFSAAVNGELTDFIIKRGIQSAEINQVQNLPAQAMHYREYSLGYTLPPGYHRLSAGIRAKLYFGKAAFFSGFSGTIHNESGDYVLKIGGKVNMSIPEGKILNEDGSISDVSFKGVKTLSYLMNSGNPGVGVDLGFKYRITPDLSFSMSVIDLGKIKWKTKLNSRFFSVNYVIHKDSITSGFNADGAEIITKKYSNPFIETVSKNFYPETDRTTAFTRTLPVTVYSGLKYQINQTLMISLVDRYVLTKDLNYNSASVMVSHSVNKKLSVSTGYSIISKSYNNIPLAFLFNRDFGQIYVGTDNLTAFILPSISDFAGFTFGACFYLFKERKIFRDPSDDFPFYQPRSNKIRRNNGLISKSGY